MSNLSDFLVAGIYPVFRNSNYTAKSNELVWVDTSSSALTITLPASPNPGATVRVGDSAQNAAVNNITIARNGNTINGLAEDFVIDENNGVIDLIWNGTTWAINVPMFGTGGLTEAQVVNVASGKNHEWVPAKLMRGGSSLNNGANALSVNQETNFQHSTEAWGFPNNLATEVHFDLVLGKRWNQGNLLVTPYWRTSGTNSGNVRWGARVVIIGDDDKANQAFQPPFIEVYDAGSGTINDLMIAPQTAPLTNPAIGGDNELVGFVIRRNGHEGDDTYEETAYLIGVLIEWTSNAPTDD